MSYFKSPAPYLLLIIVGLAVILGGCGFHPMYGGQTGKISTSELASISIRPISGRTGQFLHNLLLDLINPMGDPADPNYFLTIKLEESTEGLAVRKNTFATRANLHMTASFSLSRAKTKSRKVLFSAKSEVVSSYNIFTSNFATLAAEKKAKNLAAGEIAKDISVRLTVFLEQHQGSTNRNSPVK